MVRRRTLHRRARDDAPAPALEDPDDCDCECPRRRDPPAHCTLHSPPPRCCLAVAQAMRLTPSTRRCRAAPSDHSSAQPRRRRSDPQPQPQRRKGRPPGLPGRPRRASVVSSVGLDVGRRLGRQGGLVGLASHTVQSGTMGPVVVPSQFVSVESPVPAYTCVKAPASGYVVMPRLPAALAGVRESARVLCLSPLAR